MRPSTGKPVYQLEDIRIDLVRGCLTRKGEDQYLRHQVLGVLRFLLENRCRLVTKEELMESIWHGTAVTDNALVQCIADIRKALGDDFHHPRFIKTIPKVGYRFIGQVAEHRQETQTAALREEASLVAEPGNGSRSTVSSSDLEPGSPGRHAQRSPHRLAALLALAGIAAAAFLWLMYRPFTLPRAETTLPHVPGKKTLAVMYFENQSGRPEFDWMREGLADMFITDLAKSDNLTVLSRQQLHMLLEHIRHRQSDKIRLEEALEVARRSHAEEVVLGQFAALGDEVRIDVQVHDGGNGLLIVADRLVVSRLGDILTQVDILALKLATHVGAASLGSGKATSLSETMTDNLEAYRYYSLGVEKAQAFENTQAIRLLQKAVQLDPKFAMAYARIGYAYAVTDFVPQRGTPYLEKAFQLSDRLSEKDKLYLTTWYAIACGDYYAAIGNLRQLIAEYPLETEAYWRLARLLHGEEQPEEAVRVLQQGLAVDPEAKDLYNGLGLNYLALGRYDEALRAHQHYVELAPQEPNAHDSLGMSFQYRGQYHQAIEEYSRAVALAPEFEPAIIHLGDAYFQQGRHRDAIHQYQRYIAVTHSDVARALGYSNIGHVYLREGNLRQAAWAARNEMKYAPGSVWNSLLIAMQRDDARTIEELKRRLFQQSPYSERGARTDLRTREYFRGYLELQSGHADDAIRHFREALRHLPPTSGVELNEDCLGNAYLELGQLEQAIEEYDRILRFNPNYPLVSFHLAQAYERKGERDQARSFYERFLRNWKESDADVPEIGKAHKALLRLASVPSLK
jgi:tetratricopeptide (TPR) repeat protein/DNA-binding winged helix-turn-helix (wHTH) protein